MSMRHSTNGRRRRAHALVGVAVVCAAGVLAVGGTTRPASSASDPMLPQQWGVQQAQVAAAWPHAQGKGVTIAVLDSGVRSSHEDLAGRVVASIDCANTGGNPARCGGTGDDAQGHGTHVAGIAGATMGNGVGIAGVAPRAALMSVRVLNPICQPQLAGGVLCKALGSTNDIRAGIVWAADHGADVINLSIGPDVTTSALNALPIGDAVNAAWAKGSIVVVASGNDFNAIAGPGYDHLPMVVVGATDNAGNHAAYSNNVGNVRWGVSAPGGTGATSGCPAGNVMSTYGSANNAYQCMYGTSMAAPHVSGALALLRGYGLSPQAAVERLLGTAVDIGAPGVDPVTGVGRINLANAFRNLPVPPPPPNGGPAPGPAQGGTKVAGRSVSRPGAGSPTPGQPGAAGPGQPGAQPSANSAGGGLSALASPAALLHDTERDAPIIAAIVLLVLAGSAVLHDRWRKRRAATA